MERLCLYAMLGTKHISTGLPYTVLAGENSVEILVDLRFFTRNKRPQTEWKSYKFSFFFSEISPGVGVKALVD